MRQLVKTFATCMTLFLNQGLGGKNFLQTVKGLYGAFAMQPN